MWKSHQTLKIVQPASKWHSAIKLAYAFQLEFVEKISLAGTEKRKEMSTCMWLDDYLYACPFLFKIFVPVAYTSLPQTIYKLHFSRQGNACNTG